MSIIIEVAGKIFNHVFPVGRITKLGQVNMRVTNSSSPLGIAKNISLMIVHFGALSPTRLATHCIAFVDMEVSFAVSPNNNGWFICGYRTRNLRSMLVIIDVFLITVDLYIP